MTANDTTGSDRQEPNGYDRDVDSHREVALCKQHDDGRLTQVHIEGRFGDWSVTVTEIEDDDEIAILNLGDGGTRAGGEERAREWMEENPNGVLP